MSAKMISLLEELLREVKKSPCTAAAPPARSGNRTAPRTDYRGGNVVQDLVDVARRAIRYSRHGKVFSKKERKLMGDVIKKAKGNRSNGIVNTNGVDVWTHNRL